MNDREICLLNDSFPPLIDGVANTVVNYARVLQADGCRPIVVTPEYPGSDDSAFGYPVIRYPALDTRQFVGYMAGMPFSSKLMGELQDRNISLIHSHCPIASSLLGRCLRELVPAPFVFTYHTKFDIDIQKALRGRLIREGAVRALVDNVRASDEVWVVSRGAGENLRSLGYQGDYIVMENGVDLPRRRLPKDEYMELTAGFDIPEGVPVFLFVGRMMWYKGIRIILDALAGIRSQDMDFRMVFVGSGADELEIRRYARELGLGRSCIFTGAVHDRRLLTAWYCRADLFLFPSTFDTNGLVVREAAACSLPSVLVSGSCAAEGTEKNRNAFHITESPASLAALLMRLMENPQEMKKAGEKASEEIYISWEESVARAEERYGIVIDNYMSGKYVREKNIFDEAFKLNAEVLEGIAQFREGADQFLEGMGSVRESVDRVRDDVQNAGRQMLQDIEDIFL